MLIFVCSPLAAGGGRTMAGNIAAARDYRRQVVLMGHYPITPHLDLTEALDDNNPAEREIGLQIGETVLDRCEEVWVFGPRLSSGMRREIRRARKLGIHVVWYLDGDVHGVVGDNIILFERVEAA